jgi:putative hydrolase of the HAD superfamily
MIKAVLFDLDDTLLDRNTSLVWQIKLQYDRFYSRLQYIPKSDYVAKYIALDDRGRTAKDRLYQQIIRAFDIAGLTWENLYQDYRANFWHEGLFLFPGLHKVITSLKQRGILLGIITNGSASQMRKICVLGIEAYFDVILISGQEGIKKPNPEIFLRALARLNVSAEEGVFVGDNPVADIDGARQAGLKTIWKRDPFQEVDVVADGVIDDLREIPAMIGQFQ